MRVGLFTREYPPQVYGGAGIHVEYLSREMAKDIEVEVHCWGPQQSDQDALLAVRLCPSRSRCSPLCRWGHRSR